MLFNAAEMAFKTVHLMKLLFEYNLIGFLNICSMWKINYQLSWSVNQSKTYFMLTIITAH